MHYVSPELDIRFKEYEEKEFDAVDMQLHTGSRLHKDPNKALAKRKHTRRNARSVSTQDM